MTLFLNDLFSPSCLAARGESSVTVEGFLFCATKVVIIFALCVFEKQLCLMRYKIFSINVLSNIYRGKSKNYIERLLRIFKMKYLCR